jgi:ketosteroid isomerase-like protein
LQTTERGQDSTQATILPQAKAVEWARKLYDTSVDKKDAVGFAAVFTDDAWLRFGNNEPVIGRKNIEAAIAGFFTMLASLKHSTAGIWSQGDALILQADVTYTRLDGGIVTVPAVTIMRLVAAPKGPQVKRCQMFVDLAPLFAPS